MGFFNKLFGAAKEDSNDKKTSWFKNWYLKNDEAKWEEAERFLKIVGESFQEVKILNLKNDSNVELRGKSEGYPFRIIFSAYSFGSAEIEMKHVCPLGFIDFEYDPEISKENEIKTEDEWEDKDSSNCRLFFAKSVFIEGSESDINKTAHQMSVLSADFVKSLVNLMINNRIRYFRIRPAIIEITFMDDLIEEMSNPIPTLIGTIQMMSSSAKAVGAAKPPTKGQGEMLITCKFCKSLQYFSSDGCCNCGAPFEK